MHFSEGIGQRALFVCKQQYPPLLVCVVSLLQINVGGGYYVLYLFNGEEGTQDMCCYSEETSWSIYGSPNLRSESVNSTICTDSNSCAPYLQSTELTSFFDNYSFSIIIHLLM